MARSFRRRDLLAARWCFIAFCATGATLQKIDSRRAIRDSWTIRLSRILDCGIQFDTMMIGKTLPLCEEKSESRYALAVAPDDVEARSLAAWKVYLQQCSKLRTAKETADEVHLV